MHEISESLENPKKIIKFMLKALINERFLTSFRDRLFSCCFERCFSEICIISSHFSCASKYKLPVQIMWRKNLWEEYLELHKFNKLLKSLQSREPESWDLLTTITNCLAFDGTLLVRFQPAIKINFVIKKRFSCSK